MQQRAMVRVTELAVITTGLMAVGTLPQFVFGTLGPFLVADFQLSRTQFGALTTVLFVVAALLSPWLGHTADQLPTRLGFAAVFLVSVGSLAGLALSPAFMWLLVFSGLAGAAQALVNPFGNKLVAEHVPAARQGLIMGIKQSGPQVGTVLAGVTLPWLAIFVGWRMAIGALAGVIVFGWLLTTGRLPERRPADHRRALGKTAGANGVVVALTVYVFLMGSAMAAINAYLPLYAYEELGFAPALAGMLVGAVGLIGIVARIGVGLATDRLGDVARIMNILAVLATIGLAFLLLARTAGPAFLWLGVIASGASIAWSPVAMIAIVKLVGWQQTGRASGYVMVGVYAGFITAPVGFGALVDLTGGYALPWAVLMICLAGASVVVWIARGLRRRSHAG